MSAGTTPVRTKSILGILILALPLSLSLFAGPSDAILVLAKGESLLNKDGKKVFTGSVLVIYKNSREDNLEVSATEIVFDQIHGKNLLKCSGDTVLQSGGRTIKGKDMTIEFGDRNSTIYLLNPNGIVSGNNAAVNPGGFYEKPQIQNLKISPTFDATPGKKLELQLPRIPAITITPLGDYILGLKPQP